MNKNLNIKLFCGCILALVLFSYIWDSFGTMEMSKPWQLQPFEHEDSLSSQYKEMYRIYDKMRMISQEKNLSQKKVVVLVDAWGVPNDEKLLEQDFSFFSSLKHKKGIHQRLKNQTKHAERVELHNEFEKGIFLFGGDSSEYDRRSYIPGLGYDSLIFCQKCNDSLMIALLNTIIQHQNFDCHGLTTQDSRTGDRALLHNTLTRIADVAEQHQDVFFIVLGTHRPTLGTSNARNSHKSHWVPVVLLNESEEK